MDEPTAPLPYRALGHVPVGDSRELSDPPDGAEVARYLAALPAERLRAFSWEMLRLHRALPAAPGFIPLCSCRLPARHCEIIRAEHELLDIRMPFTFGPPQVGA